MASKKEIRHKYTRALIMYMRAINHNKALDCKMYWLGQLHVLSLILRRNLQSDIRRALWLVRD